MIDKPERIVSIMSEDVLYKIVSTQDVEGLQKHTLLNITEEQLKRVKRMFKRDQIDRDQYHKNCDGDMYVYQYHNTQFIVIFLSSGVLVPKLIVLLPTPLYQQGEKFVDLDE